MIGGLLDLAVLVSVWRPLPVQLFWREPLARVKEVEPFVPGILQSQFGVQAGVLILCQKARTPLVLVEGRSKEEQLLPTKVRRISE